MTFSQSYLKLDLHIDSWWQFQLHQGVYGLLGGLQDVQKALMRADLKLFP
jgi:hypothetical protein